MTWRTKDGGKVWILDILRKCFEDRVSNTWMGMTIGDNSIYIRMDKALYQIVVRKMQ
jgi:hypothetical protein